MRSCQLFNAEPPTLLRDAYSAKCPVRGRVLCEFRRRCQHIRVFRCEVSKLREDERTLEIGIIEGRCREA